MLDSSFGAVGKAVASNTRDLRFKSGHGNVVYHQLYKKVVLKRRKEKKKEVVNGQFLKNNSKDCRTRPCSVLKFAFSQLM